MINDRAMIRIDEDFDIEDIATSSDRINEINRQCMEDFLAANDPKDKERAFRMFLATHTVMIADEGASEEALVRNFLLSKPGLMTLLKDPVNMRKIYDAFEKHISLHAAHHLMLSPEGFVAQLRRIAQRANKALSKHSGVPGYLRKSK